MAERLRLFFFPTVFPLVHGAAGPCRAPPILEFLHVDVVEHDG